MQTSLDGNRDGNRGRRRTPGGRGPRLIVLALILALTLPASALAAKRFKLTPHIANHTPVINKLWPVRIDVTSGRKKLSGSVKYQFLFQGQIVARRPGHRFTNGVYRDTMKFTPDSFGEPLTLRIVVTVPKYGTEHLDWKIHTKR